MGVAVFFAIFQSSKLSEKKDRKQELEDQLADMSSKREYEIDHKVLNLSKSSLKDITIEINDDPERTIEVLNLTDNYIQDFNNFTLPNLQALYL